MEQVTVSYSADAAVTLSADSPQDGYFFDRWIGDDTSCIDDIYKSDAVLTMPGKDITVSASYKISDPKAPYLHWAMDETQGNSVIDYYHGGYTGIIEGTAVWTTEGAVSNALNFDGSENYVFSNYTELPDEWTVSTWINTNNLPDNTKIISIIDKENSFQLNLDHPDNNLKNSISFKINGQWYSASFGDIYPESWYHLMAQYDGSSLKTYKNGALTNSTSTPLLGGDQGVGSSQSTLTLGKNSKSDDLFSGIIDDFRIYDRVLNKTEIKELLDMGNVLLAGVDSYSVDEDTALNVDVEDGLLANDRAPDDNPLNAAIISEPEKWITYIEPRRIFRIYSKCTL